MRTAILCVAGLCFVALIGCSANDDRIKTLEATVLQLQDQLGHVQTTPGPKGDRGDVGAMGERGPAGPTVYLINLKTNQPIGIHTDGNCAIVPSIGEVCFARDSTSDDTFFMSPDCTGLAYGRVNDGNSHTGGYSQRMSAAWVMPDGRVLRYGTPKTLTPSSQKQHYSSCRLPLDNLPALYAPVEDTGQTLPALSVFDLGVASR